MIRVHFPRSKQGVQEIELVPAVRGGLAAYREDPWSVRYRSFFEQAQSEFVAVDVDDAQVVFYPHMYEAGEHADEAMRLAQSRGLPLVFIKTGDAVAPIHVPYGVVYRNSIFASTRAPCEDAMPAPCEDMLAARAGRLELRIKRAKPAIGFCGYVGYGAMHTLYRLLGRTQKAVGLELRERVLRRLEADEQLDCRFVRNNRYLGLRTGALHPDRAIADRVRNTFAGNLLDSDYTVCVRGAGNFSYRFYEALSAGRIPIYVNTDGVLPCESEIDWKKHCVWVEEDAVSGIAERVAEFHRGLDDEAFVALQHANRKLWEDYLTPLAFYRWALAKAATRTELKLPNELGI
ncbi:MAG TPA: exostosin family protein [Polyangiales bacterium]|nr:exostosin family protein [Polyangiales bacterium]